MEASIVKKLLVLPSGATAFTQDSCHQRKILHYLENFLISTPERYGKEHPYYRR